MSKRTLQLILVGCLFAGASWAATDPFIGEWKLNPSKSSKLTDQMKVESVAGNTYAFDFGGGPETIAADGTDQPGGSGTTLSATIEAPDAWKIVRKKDGHKLLTANWTLSKDGKTLTDAFTSFAPNGSLSTVNYVYTRTAGTSGFAGTWENASERSAYVMKVQPYEGDGLTFVTAAQDTTHNMKFDGRDYPIQGPNAIPGFASSGRRVNERTLELTDKVNGKIVGTRQIALSPNLKTLTTTVHRTGNSKPNILVFDRK